VKLAAVVVAVAVTFTLFAHGSVELAVGMVALLGVLVGASLWLDARS
jgi:hypothetical protein